MLVLPGSRAGTATLSRIASAPGQDNIFRPGRSWGRRPRLRILPPLLVEILMGVLGGATTLIDQRMSLPM